MNYIGGSGKILVCRSSPSFFVAIVYEMAQPAPAAAAAPAAGAAPRAAAAPALHVHVPSYVLPDATSSDDWVTHLARFDTSC